MPDFFPNNDQELQGWLGNFSTVLEINAAMVGLVPADVAPLSEATGNFQQAVAAYNQKLLDMKGATGNKRDTRVKAVDLLRPLVRRINNHPGMTNQLRGMLGLPQKVEMMRTASVVPSAVPGIFLETEPGTVIVHFGTEPQNERINGKPAGVKGCNIYRRKGPDGQYEMVDFATSSPYRDEIVGPGSDYTYYVRYRGTKPSELGQGSTPTTIAARGLEAA